MIIIIQCKWPVSCATLTVILQEIIRDAFHTASTLFKPL